MEKCILCNSTDWFKYCDLKDYKYSVLICKDCSMCRLYPLPTDTELKEFYSKTYREKYSNQDTVSKEVVDYEQIRASRILDFVKPYFKESFENVLDIGCSSGTLLKNLSRLATSISLSRFNLYGIEMNDNYRNYIVSQDITDADKISNSDIYTYYYDKKEKFDFISIVHVLEHLRSPQEALKSIYELLNKDGIFYIEVPNLKTPYSNLRKNYFAIYHLYNFTDETLRLLLEKSGFEILEKRVMATTSIAYICKKTICFKNISLNGSYEFNFLIDILNKYEKRYPLAIVKQSIIKILIKLKIKDFVKNAINKLNDYIRNN
ncbi:class I SAM-dependent methyltransferase [Campylobacter sp. MOP51]|uniref:class I SAM-dependent methyltransferase n=1 Tax=Campylobacter canis TaxID=3378588 RepID=UPI003C576AD8